MNHFPLTNHKSGISLIAVLAFMLAATTASVVLFRWLGQENFSSGARLKASEAYQASQAGLEAVQGWLTNKGADAGALIRTFENKNKPILLVSNVGTSNPAYDLLGEANFKSNNSKQQDFEVYLTGVNTSRKPYELKFLSLGKARDNSKYSQIGIFNVEGLYRIELEAPKVVNPGTAQRVPTYFGDAFGTQGLLESAYLTGDLGSSSQKMQGYSTKGDAIVTGSMYVSSGMTIGCPAKPGKAGTHQDDLIKPTTDAYPGKATWDANMNRLDIKGNLDPLYGNLYVKENYVSDALGVCGNAYVGGNLEVNGTTVIWGDLYVKGNLTIRQNITVWGNLTVEGKIDMGNASYNLNVGYNKDGTLTNSSSNLVMPNATSSFEIGSSGTNVRIGGKFWMNGTCSANCSRINKSNSYPEEARPTGANTLTYLGNQITINRGANGKYTIPDPIVLGTEWKDVSIPILAPCDTRLRANGTWANSSGTIDFSKVQDSDTFITALNKCAKTGNWTSSENNSKWLVLKVNWSHINDLHYYVLEGNFIIIVENKPSQKMYLPLTTEKSNVLLYLKQGATNMESNDPTSQCGSAKPSARTDACVRNYFIYSDADIDKIDGRFFLTGNIFMKGGRKILEMTDITIEPNENLFNALSKSGVIKDNVNKCAGTALDDGTGKCRKCTAGQSPTTHACVADPDGGGGGGTLGEIIGQGTKGSVGDPSVSYVPAIPHLKVKLQSRYATSEYSDIESLRESAEPAVLVIPRIVYAIPGVLTNKDALAKFITANYLNGAYPVDRPANRTSAQSLLVSKMASNCADIITKKSEAGIYSCTIDLKDAGKCNSDLCKNSFYVAIGTHISTKSDGDFAGPGIEPLGSGDGGDGGGEIQPDPPIGGGGVTVNLHCSVNNGVNVNVKKNTNINFANPAHITVECRYSDGVSFDVTPTSIYTVINGSTYNEGGPHSVMATSLCPNAGSQSFSATCTGKLNVVDLNCPTPSTNYSYMKVGSIISRPTATCVPTGIATGTVTWSGYPNIGTNSSFTIPSEAETDTEYPITASANCGSEEQIQKDCGKVKVAGIYCPETGTATAGGTITLPTLKCTHSNNTATVKLQPTTPAGSVGIQTVTGEADCGTESHLKDIPFACKIMVSSGGACTYKSADFCGPTYANLNNVIQTDLNNVQGNAPACIFATSIDALANVYPANVSTSTIEVNRVQLRNSFGVVVSGGRCGIQWSKDNYHVPTWNEGAQPSCAAALASVTKADGGYYIYVNGTGGYQHFFTTGGVPNCNASTAPPITNCSCETYCSQASCANLVTGGFFNSGRFTS